MIEPDCFPAGVAGVCRDLGLRFPSYSARELARALDCGWTYQVLIRKLTAAGVQRRGREYWISDIVNAAPEILQSVALSKQRENP